MMSRSVDSIPNLLFVISTLIMTQWLDQNSLRHLDVTVQVKDDTNIRSLTTPLHLTPV